MQASISLLQFFRLIRIELIKPLSDKVSSVLPVTELSDPSTTFHRADNAFPFEPLASVGFQDTS